MENNTEYAIIITNQIFSFVSILLSVVVLFVTLQMREHNQRMGWFIASICFLIGGLSYQIVSGVASNGLQQPYTAAARVFYSMIGPIFTLYFIETEKEEDQKWDGYFWTVLQSLISVLVILLIVFETSEFFIYMGFMVQHMIILIMLLISSKNIVASIGFIIGDCFPVVAALVGMSLSGLELMGFGEVMLLLIVFFCYQVDTERALLNKQVELSENKVSLLMEQIHPHFIYNSLQQIALLCDEKPEAVKPAIFSFSGYLRKNFEALTNEGLIPFEREMEHVDTYIELAEILPSRKFVVEKDLQVTDFYLPALVLQPLVENAILYGIGMSTEGDKILISTREEGGYIVISVKDDGHGQQTQLRTQKKRKSVGTKNVKTRLKILCEGELAIEKTDEGTVASIKIPLNKAKNPEKGENNKK